MYIYIFLSFIFFSSCLEDALATRTPEEHAAYRARVARRDRAAKETREAAAKEVTKKEKLARDNLIVSYSRVTMSVQNMDMAIDYAREKGQDVSAAEKILEKYTKLLALTQNPSVLLDSKVLRTNRRGYYEAFGKEKEFFETWLKKSQDFYKSLDETSDDEDGIDKASPSRRLVDTGLELGALQKKIWTLTLAQQKEGNVRKRRIHIQKLKENMAKQKEIFDAELLGFSKRYTGQTAFETVDGQHHFHLNRVLHDGECGFYTMGTSRSLASQRFLEHSADPELLYLLMGGFFMEENFMVPENLSSIPEYQKMRRDIDAKVRKHGGSVHPAEEVMTYPEGERKKLLDQYITKCILNSSEWADVSILTALAYLDKENLVIWTLQGDKLAKMYGGYDSAPHGAKTRNISNQHGLFWDPLIPVAKPK